METPGGGEPGEASLIKCQEDGRETVPPGTGQMALCEYWGKKGLAQPVAV